MKKIVGILLAGMLMFMLVACSGGTGESSDSADDPSVLPSWTSYDQAVEDAQKAIDKANERDFTALADMFEDEAATSEQLEKNMQTFLDGLGAFQDYGEATCYRSEDGDIEFVAVYQVANYEKRSITFQVNILEDGSLYGLFIV